MYQLFYLLDLANFCRVNNVPPEDVHVCPATGKWEHCSEEDCNDCSPNEEE